MNIISPKKSVSHEYHESASFDFVEVLPRAGWEHSEVWMFRTEAVACHRPFVVRMFSG